MDGWMDGWIHESRICCVIAVISLLNPPVALDCVVSVLIID
jgi:hypothetical protein